MSSRILRYWSLRFATGFGLLLASGAGVPGAIARNLDGPGNYLLLDVLCGLVGFWLSFGSVTPLVRSLAEDARLRGEWGREAHAAFRRSTTPQQVFLLLLGVAEADGRVGPAERELVRRFLLQRFVDPRTAAHLASWEAQAVPTRDLAALARAVARGLDLGERATLYSWSCLVAFADGRLDAAEHDALRQVARGLGLTDEHARLLLPFAQQVHLRGAAGARAAGGQRAGRAAGRDGAPPRPASEREQALAALGLPEGATSEMIRRRHRELVRKFHPDAQPNLGSVAQEEATERFRVIQRAYVVLTARA
jgi:uncharacterized tellurite resistance protein B-like protein